MHIDVIKKNKNLIVVVQDDHEILRLENSGKGMKVAVSTVLPVDIYKASEIVKAYDAAFELALK